MKARDLQVYLQSLNGGWVDPNTTVDTFKSGDADTEIQGIAVGWMSYSWALVEAAAQGLNVFVTHEPTYYHHRDNDPEIFRFEGAREKHRLIEEKHLVILRCHDLWDQMPGIGIPDAWANLLGLGPAIDGNGYYRVYAGNGSTALMVSRQVAARTRLFGQEAVQLIGPADRTVQRICIGTGAITPFLRFVEEYQADLAICSDDGMVYWRDAAFAIDQGIPILVVNHAVSEEAGIISLARHLAGQFPEIPVRHIPQGCMYRLVQSAGSGSYQGGG